MRDCLRQLLLAVSLGVLRAPTLLAQDEPQPLVLPCALSVADFGFSIDSCACRDFYFKRLGSLDTLFIELNLFAAGDVLGRVLRLTSYRPGYSLVRYHQNRMYTSSMGPDPVYDDWRLYTSAKDTVRYNAVLGGFYLDTISGDELTKFPPFTPEELYRAYRRQIKRNRRNPMFPGIALWAQHQEFRRHQKEASEMVELSEVELHRVVLEVLNERRRVEIVLVFVYDHFG